jgi:hypothetical protein
MWSEEGTCDEGGKCERRQRDGGGRGRKEEGGGEVEEGWKVIEKSRGGKVAALGGMEGLLPFLLPPSPSQGDKGKAITHWRAG